jgi:hypothetical protein
MRALLQILGIFVFITTGCSQRSPATNADYRIFTGAICVTHYSVDKPTIWVFMSYAPLQERVKTFCGFDSKSAIDVEDNKSMCLVIIQDSTGKMTERAVALKPIDLTKYIDKISYPVSEIIADLNAVLK